MHVAFVLLAVAVVIGAVSWACDRIGWPTPVVLVVVGAALAAVPGVPQVRLEPDVVLVGLLPPLLYSSAIRTSLVDLRANRLSLLMLSVGAVAFSTVAVGLVTWWVVPVSGFTLAAGLALGAVVAPPDAVATTAVGRRIGMPRRITALLEDESLVNDATALALLTTAVAALSRPVGPGEVAWRFGLTAAGGIVVGLVVGNVLGMVRTRLDDTVLDTTLSFAAPFVAFLPAQALHSSGVLAVVVTGVMLAQRSPSQQSAASRIAEATNWRTIAFLLENAVFLLIGLQLPELLRGVGRTHLGTWAVLGVCLAVLAATVLARAVFVFAVTGLFHLAGRRTWPWPMTTVVAWSGMRGVVTLAAAFLLPEQTPGRDLLRLAAFAVVAGTLLAQGLSLPWLVRRLGLRGPDRSEDAMAAATLVDRATRAGLHRLDSLLVGDEPPQVVEALRSRSEAASDSAWERLGRPEAGQATPTGTYRRLRLAMLSAERDTIVAARDAGTAADDVLRRALAVVDVEESMLDHGDAEADAAERDDDLGAGTDPDEACGHLRAAPTDVVFDRPDVCPDCLREGTTWVHLRGCLTCANVGCCDSSVGRHATRHFTTTRHPVMRSVEPGEAWRWCYLDEQVG